MLSPSAKNECLVITTCGLMVAAAFGLLGWWPLGVFALVVAVALLLFFRDPERRIPSQRNAVVAPADGKVSSVHRVEHYAPFDGPAVCVRIFMSVFDVHINRCPCHGKVASVTPKPGRYRNTLNPEAAEDNASNLTVLVHPVREHPVAAVRQVAGLLARTICCTLQPGRVVQRGQRMGLIKLGSTTELYLPESLQPRLTVAQGERVHAGSSVLGTVTPLRFADGDDDFAESPLTVEGQAPADVPAAVPEAAEPDEVTAFRPASDRAAPSA